MSILNHKTEQFQELYKALTNVKTVDEAKNFLEDLCTMKEIESLAQRIHVAKLLLEKKTYDQITKETDISSATLSRVSRCIRYGNGGYKTILEKKDS